MARCQKCGGNGWLSVDQLITYDPHWAGYKPQSRQSLKHLTPEEVLELGAKLGPNQAIVSAAVACECLPMNHLAFTEGR